LSETMLNFSEQNPFLAIPEIGIDILTVVVKDEEGKVLLSEQVLVR